MPFQNVLETGSATFSQAIRDNRVFWGTLGHPEGSCRIGESGKGQLKLQMSESLRELCSLGDKPACSRGCGIFLNDTFLYMSMQIFLIMKVNQQKEVFTPALAILSNEPPRWLLEQRAPAAFSLK